METRDSLLQKLFAKTEADTDFRGRLLANPRSALKEAFDVEVPDEFKLEVHEDDARTAHIVLPASAELTDSQLEQVTGGELCYASGWGI